MCAAPLIPSALEDRLLARLAETANRNKTIEEFCLETGLTWGEGEALLDQLLQTRRPEVIRRQGLVRILLAFSLFCGGMILIAWNLLGVFQYLWPSLDSQTPDALGWYFFYSDLFQALLFKPLTLPLFVTGLAMLLGSYLGMKEVWASIFDWFDQAQPLSLPNLLTPSRSDRDPGVVQPAADLTLSAEQLDYLNQRLDDELSETQLAEELWLKFGLPKPAGRKFVANLLAARGLKSSPRLSLGLFLGLLAAAFSGLVFFTQSLVLVSAYLASRPLALTGPWYLFFRLVEAGRYLGSSPGLLTWFCLGFLLLVGGLIGLKNLWPSLFRLLSNQA